MMSSLRGSVWIGVSSLSSLPSPLLPHLCQIRSSNSIHLSRNICSYYMRRRLIGEEWTCEGERFLHSSSPSSSPLKLLANATFLCISLSLTIQWISVMWTVPIDLLGCTWNTFCYLSIISQNKGFRNVFPSINSLGWSFLPVRKWRMHEEVGIWGALQGENSSLHSLSSPSLTSGEWIGREILNITRLIVIVHWWTIRESELEEGLGRGRRMNREAPTDSIEPSSFNPQRNSERIPKNKLYKVRTTNVQQKITIYDHHWNELKKGEKGC